MAKALPRFTEHEGHAKLEPITSPTVPARYFRAFLDDFRHRSGRETAEITVLDVGCGRGDTVAWLCDSGWDAYGLDIDERYLAQGRDYVERSGRGDRLRLLEGRYPFPDQTFDVILSDQVIEHVADLDQFCSEVARVSKVGGVGLHVFPARWRPVESHLLAPVVHWLPKGRARRLALRPLLAMGLAAPYFGDRPLSERVEIYGHYSDTETFYRGLRELQQTCRRHGLAPDVNEAARAKIGDRLPRMPAALANLAAMAYRHTFSVYLKTQRTS
ncbi:MAG TPA: class I SAM-dependent methyltransferase [Propionibacteriaceae bacterium]|nr:class I SAM-dependent methyltransferase [Propionibacteriaceae bacterium]